MLFLILFLNVKKQENIRMITNVINTFGQSQMGNSQFFSSLPSWHSVTPSHGVDIVIPISWKRYIIPYEHKVVM